MRTKYYAYDRWVSLFIVTCETLITGGLFYLLFLTTEDTPWHKILQAPHLQVILTVMLCYFVSAMQAGVVLYRRKVYAYQILNIIGGSVGAGTIHGCLVVFLPDFFRIAVSFADRIPYSFAMGPEKIPFERW